jgi:hypothetical protein
MGRSMTIGTINKVACAPKQSRAMSMIEAATNVVVGYVLAIATQIVVFPWFGIHPNLGENLSIGLLFTGVSLARGYLLRRLFERLHCGLLDWR